MAVKVYKTNANLTFVKHKLIVYPHTRFFQTVMFYQCKFLRQMSYVKQYNGVNKLYNLYVLFLMFYNQELTKYLVRIVALGGGYNNNIF
jgi:hypothetical protein